MWTDLHVCSLYQLYVCVHVRITGYILFEVQKMSVCRKVLGSTAMQTFSYDETFHEVQKMRMVETKSPSPNVLSEFVM